MDKGPKYKITKIKALKYFNATRFLYCYFASVMLSQISYFYFLNGTCIKLCLFRLLSVTLSVPIFCKEKYNNCANDRNLKGFAGFIKLKADAIGIASLLETKRIHSFIV